MVKLQRYTLDFEMCFIPIHKPSHLTRRGVSSRTSLPPFSLQRKQFSGSELIWLWLMEQSVQEGRASTSERQWPKDPCYCIYPACRRIAGPRCVCLSVCVCWAFVVQCLLAWRFSIESVVLEVISLSHGLQHIQGSTMAKMSEFSMLLAGLI